MWIAGSLFHIGWSGNFSLYISNPVISIPISHSVWDPHFANFSVASSSAIQSSCPSYSGLYSVLYTIGICDETQVFYLVLSFEALSLISLMLGKFYFKTYLNSISLPFTFKSFQSNISFDFIACSPFLSRLYLTFLDSSGFRLNYHLAVLFGTTSLLWAGHLVHVSIPASRSIKFSQLENLSL